MKIKPLLNVIYGIFLGIIITGIIWITSSPPRGEEVSLLPTPTPGMLTIYVSGAVMVPGIYILPDGSRVEDAIKAAGGLSTGADLDLTNLAERLMDAQQVNIHGIISLDNVITLRININIASAAELDTLPSIGSTTAQSIVDYRLEHGPFKSIQDIKKVPGIGQATYEKIKDYITVGE